MPEHLDGRTTIKRDMFYYSGQEGARVKVPSLFFVIIIFCVFCSEFPARLQSLNSATKPEHIQRGRNFRHFEIGRRYKVTAEITSATLRRMIKIACDLTTVRRTKDARS